ncbi:anti-sigma regulatory factor (Ser/Thr protein kinase) [Actinokineospora baliensis]|uniref:anti-sigma factor RsbA family regulatory protein n=1 Tax=Actinokineospora baliensis TaxID=547056 RepID=UPI001956C4C9|nr:anti-sigma factor RsbA family regulatory protein [Actinokineospora baliensis]MBM7774300.1 anti-sigma regulatory factor (Ser/Thr protein kinase) [Actinokineospora baliensis]
MSAHTHSAKRGYDHVALYYTNDGDLLDGAVPFLVDGVARDEAMVIALDEPRADLVLSALPDPDRVVTLQPDPQYTRPAATIKAYRDMFSSLVKRGASAIRVVGELPSPALAQAWDVWSRYEAAVNYAYDAFPVRSMCAYDTRTTPAPILRDVARTHSLVAVGGTPKPNPEYVEPPSFLSRSGPPTPLPVQHLPPTAALIDPTPAAARHAVTAAGAFALSRADLEDLVTSVSEIVTNAVKYGTPPVTVRLWTGPRQVVVTIHDGGRGPVDPFAGLVPTPNPDGGGYGLWIAHQLCHHVTLSRAESGFTVRLTMGQQS